MFSFVSGDGGRLELETLDSIPWQPSEIRSGHRLIAMPDAMYAILPGMTLAAELRVELCLCRLHVFVYIVDSCSCAW